MAISLVSKQGTERTHCLLRLSCNFFRSYVPPPVFSEERKKAIIADLTKKRLNKKTLFEVCKGLPNWGYGCHVTRHQWKRAGYTYEISKIILDMNGIHGKAFGYLYQNGVKKFRKPRSISGASRRRWKFVHVVRKPNPEAVEEMWMPKATPSSEKITYRSFLVDRDVLK